MIILEWINNHGCLILGIMIGHIIYQLYIKRLLKRDKKGEAMSRYIDADTLKEKFTSKWILDRIEQQPTADVVEVVRCKDCEHRFKNKWFCCDGRCLDDEHFCSYGEPKSESLRFYKKAKEYADGFQKGLEDAMKEDAIGDMWSIDPREIEEDYIFKWEDVMKEAEEKTSVVSDLKRILNSNLVYLIDNAKNFNEQIERWDAVKNTNWIECKQGEWLESDFGWRCSICGNTSVMWQRTYNFCPNCGAKMYERGEE